VPPSSGDSGSSAAEQAAKRPSTLGVALTAAPRPTPCAARHVRRLSRGWMARGRNVHAFEACAPFSTSCRDEFGLGRSPHTQTPLSCPRRRYRQEARGHRIKTYALDALQAALALSGRFECDADAAPPIVGVELDCSGALRSAAELRVAMPRLHTFGSGHVASRAVARDLSEPPRVREKQRHRCVAASGSSTGRAPVVRTPLRPCPRRALVGARRCSVVPFSNDLWPSPRGRRASPLGCKRVFCVKL
jgi:hypothetical protein